MNPVIDRIGGKPRTVGEVVKRNQIKVLRAIQDQADLDLVEATVRDLQERLRNLDMSIFEIELGALLPDGDGRLDLSWLRGRVGEFIQLSVEDIMTALAIPAPEDVQI